MKGDKVPKIENKSFENMKPSLDLFVKENQMTKREREILTLLIQQKVSADELGEALGISKNTVRIHLRNINTKLNISSKSELLGKFIEFAMSNLNTCERNKIKRENLNLLLIDDDESYVELMKKAAESAGNIEVNYVLSGDAMIDYLHNAKVMKQGYSIPSFILLDLSMPKMNGFEALSLLKQDPILNKIPVIIFSSSIAKEDVSNTYALGANSFVTKPDDYEDLKSLMITLCHYWGQVEALAYY